MGMNTDAVQRLYVAYFNRPADPASLSVYEGLLPTDRVATQAELQSLAEQYFSPSAEYTARYAGMSNSQIINTMYQNLFGRDAEPAGLLSWTGKLNTGAETFASIALQLSYSAQGTDADSIAAKISAANAFTTEVASTSANIIGFSGNDAAASARSWLATVTDAASGTTAEAGVAAAVTASVAAGNETTPDAAQSVVLTTATNNSTTGSGDDTFSATPATLTTGDTLDGGAGSDTLTVAADLTAAAAVGGFTLTNIETAQVNVTDGSTGAAHVLTANMLNSSATTITTSGLSTTTFSDGVTYNNVAAGTTINVNSATNIDVTANFVAAATAGTTALGTPDTVTVTLSGNTATAAADGVLTIGTGFETIDITSSGTASSLGDIVTSTATTMNVSGDANLTVRSALDATLETIDASTMTGALAITTANDTVGQDTAVAGVDVVDVTITGGSGNDTITATANNADNELLITTGAGDDTVVIGATPGNSSATNAGDTLTGGAGTDTLTAQVDLVDAAAITTALTGVSGFETLNLSGAATGTDVVTVANVSSEITRLNISSVTAGTGLTVNWAANGTIGLNVAASITAGDTLTVDSGTGTSDALTITNMLTTGQMASATSGITTTDFETVTLNTGAYTTAAAQLIGAINVGANTLNIAGSNGLTTTATNGIITATTIDASAMTGALVMNVAAASVTTITGGSAADTLVGDAASTINGGAGNDSITGGSGNDTLNGDAGDDTLITGAGTDTTNGGAGDDTLTYGANVSANDVIGGGAGTDTLSMTNASVITLGALGITAANTFNTNLTGVERVTITDDLDATGDSFDFGRVDGIQYVTLNDINGDQTISGIASGATIVQAAAYDTATDTLTTTVTSAAAGSADTLNMTLAVSGTTDFGVQAIADVETLNLVASEATASSTVQALTIGLSLSATATASGGSGADQSVIITGTESLTIDTAVAADVIDASGMTVVAAVTEAGLSMGAAYTATTTITGQTITGSGKVDTLRGSTGADTITAGAGADIIHGNAGGDTIDGGAGTDTFHNTGMVGAVEGTGAGTSTGIVVNMGATALTGANVFGTTTQYLSGSLSSVEAGKVAYVYGAEASTNSAAVDTISNIENIDLSGANGINYVVGSTAANTITGGSGVDTISGGAGNDSITGAGGNDALTGGAGVDTFVVSDTGSNNGSDTISDFTVGASGDVIDVNATLAAGGAVQNSLSGGLYVSPTATALATQGTSIAVDNELIIINSSALATTGYDTAAEVVTLLADGGAFDAVDFAASKDGFALIAANDGTSALLWMVENDGTPAVAAGELTLVATITIAADGIDALAAANFTTA